MGSQPLHFVQTFFRRIIVSKEVQCGVRGQLGHLTDGGYASLLCLPAGCLQGYDDIAKDRITF